MSHPRRWRGFTGAHYVHYCDFEETFKATRACVKASFHGLPSTQKKSGSRAGSRWPFEALASPEKGLVSRGSRAKLRVTSTCLQGERGFTNAECERKWEHRGDLSIGGDEGAG